MLKDLSIVQFCDEVDSVSPAPGGGSVAALVGTLGIALVRMYGHLSINKKRFKELDEHTQQAFITTFEQLENKRQLLCDAIDLDSIAYGNVMDAIHMPKNSEEEIQERKKALDKANEAALLSPYNVMELSYESMLPLMKMIPFGNKNAISDIAVGILLLDSALQGAGYNVRINLSSLDENERSVWKAKMEELILKSNELKTALLREIDQYM